MHVIKDRLIDLIDDGVIGDPLMGGFRPLTRANLASSRSQGNSHVNGPRRLVGLQEDIGTISMARQISDDRGLHGQENKFAAIDLLRATIQVSYMLDLLELRQAVSQVGHILDLVDRVQIRRSK